MQPTIQGDDLLGQAYEKLNLLGSNLLTASSSPHPDRGDEWRSLGEWLMLAARMGAERVFFVGDDPVVLFARLPSGADETNILTAYRRAWSLARPRCLFLVTEDELRVYALSRPPAKALVEADSLRPLEIVTRSADIADRLALYNRESLESGALFESDQYSRRQGRADTQLLKDVQAATKALVGAGLDRSLAHTLIERVILIRYLEDRDIVNRDYFADVAAVNDRWHSALQASAGMPLLGASSTFVNCLTDKSFTYAVFERLALDFNGDLFVVSENEPERVNQEHLLLVRGLLTGAGMGDQEPLFLWAYDFSVVPTSLISSMYEEFYRAGTDDDSGTHYTSPELVEFVLSQVLTPDVLDACPVICDPACGSGIFLVEAFRRISRHEAASDGRQPTPQHLRRILLERLVGIDLNAEAVRLAAFSLYLAYLNYQSPRDIRSAGPLPRLIHRPGEGSESGTLIVADAFAPTITEAAEAGDKDIAILPWDNGRFDVVVGNPPWDEPKASWPRTADQWADRRGLTVGDRNPSQLFLWRTLSLLKTTGVAGLLVGATALHNRRHRSQLFREQWLDVVELDGVVNFTAARDLFFDGGIAPFLLLTFRHRMAQRPALNRSALPYRTVRPSQALAITRSLGYARSDRRWVWQDALQSRDYLWKTYAWGNHHDAAFMARLDAEKRLTDFIPAGTASGYGYQRGNDAPSRSLASLRSLRRFDPWGPLLRTWFEDPPVGVKRQPDEHLYHGQRIIVARGVRSGFGPSARLESEPFAFRHTIYSVPLPSLPEWQAQSILGVLLSSLGRYRLFMASGSWGVWHDSLVPDDILGLPMRIPESRDDVTKRIVSAVQMLRNGQYSAANSTLFASASTEGPRQLVEVLAALDSAVFDLFELTTAERDLVVDFCDYMLPLVGRRSRWTSQPTVDLKGPNFGTIADLAANAEVPLRRYLEAFMRVWNRELAPEGEFSWQVVAPKGVPFFAVVFETQEVGSLASGMLEAERPLWDTVLDRLSLSLGAPFGPAMRTSGLLRTVSDTSIVIAKQNELRMWTASAAREDAEATLLQAMALRGS